ncbi:hypothetical protein vseg_011043 [Gypsophila vaccaria]
MSGSAMKEIKGTWWTIDLDEELKTLRSKVEHLSALESDILVAVENGEIQPEKKRKREVEWWVGNVKQKKSELEDIETELKCRGPSRALKSRIEKKTVEVAELIQQGKFSGGILLTDHSNYSKLAMVTTTLVGQSCAENISVILRSLQNDDVLSIGVYGMGGVGKTALLKQIYNHLLQDCKIAGQVHWVTASRDCSLLKLQNAIGKTLGLDLSLQEDVERRRALIFQRLSKLEKSVLIIDDLWNYYLVDQIGIPLNTSSCKIILTTRSLDVCRRMNCQQVLKVTPLLEKEAWKLFVDNLGCVPPNLYPVVVDVVKECGGLPLALITMGCSMRGINDVHQWENTLYELRKPLSRHDDMGDEVFRLLKFSYDSLKDEKVKHCFLSCVLFPEDVKIFRENLIDLWIMEGLLDERESKRDQQNYGHSILNRLENASLLETGIYYSQRCVTMHDLLRDMALIVTENYPRFLAKSGLQLKKVPEEQHWTKDLVKVSLSWNNLREIPFGMSPNTPKLKVLLLNDNPLKEIPSSFFALMKELTILDLFDTKIERLPESLSDLENLRSLLLGGCLELQYVPSVAKLVKLRVLNLPNSRKIKETPKEAILEDCDQLRYAHSPKVPKLRVLDIRLNGKLEHAPIGLEKLKCVETLCSCPWKMADVKRFNTLIQSWQFHVLERYDFWLYDEAHWHLLNVMDYYPESCQKRVIILGGSFGEGDLSPLLPYTTELLDICDMETKVNRGLLDVFPSLAGLTQLKVLKLANCVGIEALETQEEDALASIRFETLERLNVYKLPDLRRITNSRNCCFSELRVLKIERCQKLKVCLPLKSQHHHLRYSLPNLQHVEVKFCKEVEQIFYLDDDLSPCVTIDDEINPKADVALSSLTRLVLCDLPNLRSICKGRPEDTCLWELNILDCPNLERTPPLGEARNALYSIVGELK